jgi:glycosyltransferase involved in cell wall biosynthesis
MSMKIRVLNVLLDDRIGGPSRRVLSMARKLHDKGIEYLMCLPKGNGEVPLYARKQGMTVYQCELGTPHYIRSIVTFFLNIRYIFNFIPSIHSLVKIIKKEKIDVVHVHGLLNLQGALAAFLTRRKVVWHLFGTLYPEYLVKALQPFIKRTADRVVNISEITRDYYINGSDIADVVIRGPVDVQVFNPLSISLEEKSGLMKELNLNDDDIILGSVGNITWVKGYENLIEALAIVRKKYSRIKLLIVGRILDTQISYYRRLTNLTSYFGLDENIRFLGEREGIPQLLSLMDIFIQSSFVEGTPISIMEAMAMRVPVIASSVGGIPEQITGWETGMLVPAGDPPAIALAVLNLMESVELRKEMGRKARETVRERFSLRHCVREHERLYKELIK